MTDEDPTTFFWATAKDRLGTGDVRTGTMMGFPCLRVRGAFFASCDHRNGDLIVKLPAERVSGLIAEGAAQPFAPAGKVFREWARVPDRDSERWRSLLDEAQRFVEGPLTARPT
jgi:hypothetical protein